MELQYDWRQSHQHHHLPNHPIPTECCVHSYINDVRFDLRPDIVASGQGVAYITDSSQEGRNGITIVDLGTGESWRHLDGTTYVHPETGFSPSHLGQYRLLTSQRTYHAHQSKHFRRQWNRAEC